MNAPTPRPASYQPVTIAEGLRTAAAHDPDKVAFSEEGRAITYAQLMRRINQVSNAVRGGLGSGLRGLVGVGPG